MDQPSSLKGNGFLLLANGDRYPAAYDLTRTVAPVPQPGRSYDENRRYHGMLDVLDYADSIVPAATRLELADGRTLRLRTCDSARRRGTFEIDTGLPADACLN